MNQPLTILFGIDCDSTNFRWLRELAEIIVL